MFSFRETTVTGKGGKSLRLDKEAQKEVGRPIMPLLRRTEFRIQFGANAICDPVPCKTLIRQTCSGRKSPARL